MEDVNKIAAARVLHKLSNGLRFALEDFTRLIFLRGNVRWEGGGSADLGVARAVLLIY